MSATITVQRGSNSGEQYWIEAEVSKIGSGSDCTFIVPGTPAHCLTLMYRGGQYSVVNRCRQAIDVAGEPLLPTGTTPLGAGDTIAIGSATMLRLDVAGDPAPSRRPRSVIDSTEGEQSDPTESSRLRTTTFLCRCLMVVAALLAGGYLLLGDSSRESHEEQMREAFRAIVDRLHGASANASDLPSRICREIQNGRAAETRGYPDRARVCYEKAKGMLANAGQDPAPCADGHGTAAAYSSGVEYFLKSRLALLR
jgi:hypothetical protein